MSIRLATGLARSEGRVLLVASRYPSHDAPLWNLPGGRQQPGELLEETVVREVREETGLAARILGLAYVSESYDGATHVVNATFEIEVRGAIATPAHGDHVAEAAWVPLDALAERLAVRVVREPLLAYLERGTRYAGFHDAGITIVWPEDQGSRSST